MITTIGWTGTPSKEPIHLREAVRFGGKVFLHTGRYNRGTILPGFTFNPVLGCQPISRACKHCYAQALVEGRMGYAKADAKDARHRLTLWGPPGKTARPRTSKAYWRQPVKWNALAKSLGTSLKVFCGSLCDVGEDNPDVRAVRPDLFELVDATPYLTWLFLTKRPHVLEDEWPGRWRAAAPHNVWVGATVEDQPSAEARVGHLLGINAIVNYVSAEPLCGPLDLTNIKSPKGDHTLDALRGIRATPRELVIVGRRVSWVIPGGESGPGHETMELDWLYDLAAQVERANAYVSEHDGYDPAPEWERADNTALHVKQDSGHLPSRQGRIRDDVWRMKRWPRALPQVLHA